MRFLVCFTCLLAVACQPMDVVDDVEEVSKETWKGKKAYPFTTHGEIACSLDAVFFLPEDYSIPYEYQIGSPLNQVAADTMKDLGYELVSTGDIKPDVDLTEAIEMGLDICRESGSLTEILKQDKRYNSIE